MSTSDLSLLNSNSTANQGSNPHLLCLEVNPPRGTDIKACFDRLGSIAESLNFFNVTDCALARMKLAGLPFGALLKKEFEREVMVNLACRDRNLIALQADMLAAWVMGVRSLVALTGDAVSVGDSPDRKGVFEVNSVGLLQAIATLNSGKDLDGHELKGKPDFIPGAVCNPNAKNTEVEVRRLTKKMGAGARYALSQPVFDEVTSEKFFSLSSGLEISVFVGLMPLKNSRALQAIDSVPGIKLGDEFKEKALGLSDAALAQFSVDHALKLAKKLGPYVRGFHVISGGYPSLANELTVELARMIKGGEYQSVVPR